MEHQNILAQKFPDSFWGPKLKELLSSVCQN